MSRLRESGKVVFYDGDPRVHFPPVTNGFDIIYLNKSKDFAGIMFELDCAYQKLNNEGFLVVNDFIAWDPVQGIPYGVMPAVSQFANDRAMPVRFLSLHPRGFSNIALQRIK